MVDLPDADPELLRGELRNLRRINRYFGGHSAVRKALMPMLIHVPFDHTVELLDLATGSPKWKGGRYGHGQVLLVGDVLLVTTESGEVVLVDAVSTGHHERSRFEALTGKTWNNAALSGRYLLVRNDQEAACYELPLDESEAPVLSTMVR